MNKKPKLVYGIKGKLVSAACMLLVAVIMVVSSTYAWFTLSTAPEVTGIQTAVGSNGSLEMALLPESGKVEDILTYTGTDTTDINTTWGNLVDLSGNLGKDYGLSKITLYPSQLNLQENGILPASGMLLTPSYGADGRVTSVTANTVNGVYGTSSFASNSSYGVRAVGVASGMTARQLTYRNAMATANTAMSMAKTVASASLTANGNTLANIAMKKATATAETNTTYTQADVAALQVIVDDLLGIDGENAKTGALEYIEKAYKYYILAIYASATSSASEDEVVAVEKLIDATPLADLKAKLPASTDQFNTTKLITGIDAYEATLAEVKSAQTDLEYLESTKSDTIAWSVTDDADTTDVVECGMSTPLYKLADVDNMKINGYEASTVKTNMSAIVNSVASGGLTVTMETNGGVYADIADQCGDYSAAVVIERVEYNKLVLENMNARMETASTVDPAYLSFTSTLASSAGAPAAGNGATEMPMTEFYGYIIDLAFRTNAADSNLLLQTAPVDRIYSDNGNDETMGHGSTMTFTTADVSFTTEQMKNLMSALRVVFFDAENKVVATAKLDINNTIVTNNTTVTANLYLFDTVTTYTYTATGDDPSTADTEETDFETTVTVYEHNGKYYSDEALATETTKPTQTLTKGNVKETLITTQADAVLMALTQNQAHKLSALVYLDGAQVENADVAAKAAQSMSGTMNLQFSSSATLIPMDYADLHTSVEKGALELTKTGVDTDVTGSVKTDGATNYTSNNTAVCTVDSTGTVTALTTGTVTITARDASGKAVKVWTVTVK